MFLIKLKSIFIPSNGRQSRLRYLALLIPLLQLMGTILPAQTVVGTITRPGLRAWFMECYQKENKLVVSDWGTNHVLIYDGANLSLLAEIDPKGLTGRIQIAESTGEAFVDMGSDNNKIAVIDLSSYQLNLYLEGISGDMKIDEALGRLYVNDPMNKMIYVIDLITKAYTPIATNGLGPIRLNPVTNEVFFGPVFGSTLEILDGSSLTFSSTNALMFPDGKPMGAWDIKVNWRENKVYGSTIIWNGYWIYDRMTGSAKKTSYSTDASALVYNPTSNRIHTDSEVNAMTVIIDGATDSSWLYPMYPGTISLAVCEPTNRVYYANADHIIILDDETDIVEQILILGTNATNGHEEAIAVNQTAKRVFVANDFLENPVITVIQDSTRLTRPPVYLSPLGTSYYIADPASKQLVEWRLNKGFGLAFWSELATSIGGSELYTLEAGMAGASILSMFRGCGHFSKSASFETGGKNPVSPVMAPDGRHVYITNSGSNDVNLVDLKTQTLVQTIPVGAAPWGAAITSDGKTLLVGNHNDNTVSVIQTATNSVKKTIAVGATPWDVAINPSGTKAYVVNSSGNSVSVIDLIAEKVASTIPVGETPRYASITPDGNHVYVTNCESDEVFVIDAATDKVLRKINVGHSWGVCALPDGKEVYVGNDSIAVAINTRDFSVTPMKWINQQGFKVRTSFTSIVATDPTSRFAGRLTNSQGKAIAGAEVRAWQNGIVMGTATSNAAGDFCVYNLQPGSYDLDVTATGASFPRLTGLHALCGRTHIVDFSQPVGIKDNIHANRYFQLLQNYPNPFNACTVIEYGIPKPSQVDLIIFDLLGREQKVLVTGKQEAGTYKVQFDSQGLSSGLYFYRLQAGEFCETKKMIIVK